MTRRGEAGFLNNSCRNRIHGRLADRPGIAYSPVASNALTEQSW